LPAWLVSLLRAAGLVLLALFAARLAGKKQTARLNLFDLTTAIVFGVGLSLLSLNLVPNPGLGYLGLAVWVLLPVGFNLLSLKYKAVRDLVQGKETVLIKHGKVLEDSLMGARLTPEDLLSGLRKKNVFNFADVEFATLEADGELGVFLKKDRAPVTPKVMGLSCATESAPQTVVLDGEVLDESLAALGLNRQWLHTELEKAGVAPENVFIAQVDGAGQLYLDLFDDAVGVPQPKTRELVFLTLKKCQADLELYALETREPRARRMYADSSAVLAQSLRELEPLLRK